MIMANRNKNFDEDLAKQMQDSGFSQSFLIANIEEHGDSIQDALRASIEAFGLSAFAKKHDFSIQVVSDFVHKRREFKVASLDKFLNPFGLKIRLKLEKVA